MKADLALLQIFLDRLDRLDQELSHARGSVLNVWLEKGTEPMPDGSFLMNVYFVALETDMIKWWCRRVLETCVYRNATHKKRKQTKPHVLRKKCFCVNVFLQKYSNIMQQDRSTLGEYSNPHVRPPSLRAYRNAE